VMGMIKLEVSITGAGRVIAVAIAAMAMSAGSCRADELGPSCKQYLQLKMQCMEARADRIASNGNTEGARQLRRSIPFEVHQAIYYLAKNKPSRNIERDCADDAWYIQNADSAQNSRPERSVRLCSVTTSWPENYKITPDADSEVEARIRKMESEIRIVGH